ncbi:MAG: 2-hydroxy-6-oxohepta-2,4-dienoate hydrolase [Sulfurovum sp. AS07-7]|nr:MAG: 2-hydroxy-6-oxohepta-2,4-dienoate hydrolase [Sulfurovum sp. AS07-7]
MAIKEIPYKDTTISLSYDLINPTATSSILILHGWGSNKEIMKQAFAKKMPSLKHIYLDMAGFGKSSNSLILTTQDYASITKLFLESLSLSPKIAVGHSFGGKVATLLNTPYLVLLSSSGVLVPKPFKIRAKIALFKFFKTFGVNQMLRKLFVSDDAKDMPQNMYETFKNVVDEDFEASFSASKSIALLFWGKQDTATPLWTAEKIDKLIEKSTLYPLDGDHYFFLKHADFIANEIETKTRG